MATALDPTLKDKQFQNWLKGAFTILFGTEALKEFVENEIIDFHKYVMQVVSQQTELSPATCNTCTTANMLSCPTEGFCNKRKRCYAHDNTIKAPNIPCPKGICNVIKHEVCHDHRFANPSWNNTDAQKWCSDAFQLAKCYMPDGYFDKTTSEDIDFNGLISVVINSKRFQRKLSAKLDVEPNVCSRTRDIGRQFRHSPDFLLSDVELAKCIDAFLDLLQDSAYLLHNVKVHETVQKIKELKNITVVIQTGNITRATFMTQNDAVQEIRELFRNYQLEVNSRMNAIQALGTEALEECQRLQQVFQESIEPTQLLHTKITEDLLKYQRPLEVGYYTSSNTTCIDDVLPETTIPDCNSGTTLKTGDSITIDKFVYITLSGFINHPHYGLCGLSVCKMANYPTDSVVFLLKKHKKGKTKRIRVGRLVKPVSISGLFSLVIFQVETSVVITGILFCLLPQDAIDALTEYFNPKKIIAYERHVFRQAKQNQDETIDNFIIRQLSLSCDYPGEIVNGMIRDQVIENCKSTGLKRKYLTEQDLTLEKLQSIARSSEMADLHVRKMSGSTESAQGSSLSDGCSTGNQQEAYQIGKQHPKKSKKQFNPRGIPAKQPARFKICFRCGAKGHSVHDCMKSRNIQCRKCYKYGHFAQMCKTKAPQRASFMAGNHENQSSNESENESESSYVFTVQTHNKGSYVDAVIEGNFFKLLIDSGASINCLDRDTYFKVKAPSTTLRMSNAKIYSYASSTPLKLLGTANMLVKVGSQSKVVTFHVIDSKCQALLGFECAINFGILNVQVNHLNEGDSVTSILNKFSDRFQGLGKLEDFELKLHVNKNVTPIVQPASKLPFQMRERVNAKLQV